jgi:hypothetical protein
MGEITVLAVAALGVVNLVRVAERNRRARAAMTGDAGTKESDARLEPGSAS